MYVIGRPPTFKKFFGRTKMLKGDIQMRQRTRLVYLKPARNFGTSTLPPEAVCFCPKRTFCQCIDVIRYIFSYHFTAFGLIRLGLGSFTTLGRSGIILL